jgi:hypothetical protein
VTRFRELHRDLSAGIPVPDALERHLSLQRQNFSEGHCTNVHTIISSSRGDGSEALALITPVSLSCSNMSGSNCWHEQDQYGAAASLSIGYVLSRYLAEVPWLARDFVWVVLDARCGVLQSADAWMAAQQGFSDVSGYTPQRSNMTSPRFGRTGAMQQVRVLSCPYLECVLCQPSRIQNARVYDVSQTGV